MFSWLLFFLFLSEQGVSQGSPLSPILFLFYNADLIDIRNSTDRPAIGIGFVDDANALAFGKSSEETCSVLKDIHSDCLTWGDMHGTSYAPHKYVLVHFPKIKQNLPITPLELPTFTLHPCPRAQVLALFLIPSSPGTPTLHTLSQNCVHKPLP